MYIHYSSRKMDEYISEITETLHGRLPIPRLHMRKYNMHRSQVDLSMELPEIYHSPEKFWYPVIDEILMTIYDRGKSPSLFRHIFSLAKNISKIIIRVRLYKNKPYVFDRYDYKIYDMKMKCAFSGKYFIYNYSRKFRIEDYGFIEISKKNKNDKDYTMIDYSIEKI